MRLEKEKKRFLLSISAANDRCKIQNEQIEIMQFQNQAVLQIVDKKYSYCLFLRQKVKKTYYDGQKTQQDHKNVVFVLSRQQKINLSSTKWYETTQYILSVQQKLERK